LGGDLRHHLVTTHLKEPRIIPMIRRVIVALNHMHAVGRAHRDGKLENILVDLNDRVRQIYLGDPGFAPSHDRHAKKFFTELLGILEYCALELLTV
jgi:serine/threonine protein kinase